MMTIKIKGVNPVRDKRTGEVRYYLGRNKGAVRLKGVPGTPEFMASYTEALASRKPADNGKMRALVSLYRSSAAFTGLAPKTREIWSRWLDRIVERFRDYSVAQFGRAETIRPIIRKWRDKWADRPRSADYAMQVLSRLLTHAVDLDKISANPCEGIKGIYKNDRSDIIWTDADLERFKAVARPDVWNGVPWPPTRASAPPICTACAGRTLVRTPSTFRPARAEARRLPPSRSILTFSRSWPRYPSAAPRS